MQDQDRFGHVYWLGGSPCSGKTSIARQLAAQLDLELYICDEHFPRHVAGASPVKQPTLARIASLSWEQVFMAPVEEQVARTLAAYREEFALILADLATNDEPLIAEGAALMPELLAGVAGALERAAWVIPDESFQRQTYARREWIQGILAETSDPEQAFENWMARDAVFAQTIQAQAAGLGRQVLVVNGEQTIEENGQIVARWLGLER